MARIPALTRESVPESQRAAFDDLVEQRGGVPMTGPGSVMLNAPEVAQRALGLAMYLRTETSLAPRISVESVLQRNPEVIVASGAGTSRPPWLDLWARYPSLAAVQNRALFFINPDQIQRPTARLLQGANELCAMLESVRLEASPCKSCSHVPQAEPE